jgi:hypothetical protein
VVATLQVANFFCPVRGSITNPPAACLPTHFLCVVVSWCRGVVVSWCRGVVVSWCRGVVVSCIVRE